MVQALGRCMWQMVADQKAPTVYGQLNFVPSLIYMGVYTRFSMLGIRYWRSTSAINVDDSLVFCLLDGIVTAGSLRFVGKFRHPSIPFIIEE